MPQIANNEVGEKLLQALGFDTNANSFIAVSLHFHANKAPVVKIELYVPDTISKWIDTFSTEYEIDFARQPKLSLHEIYTRCDRG